MTAKLTIAISGIDGSGKTTLANSLKAYFRKKGKEVIIVWFRWRAFLQYLLFAYSNLRGLKKYVRTIGGITITRHFFEEDPITQTVYPIFLLFDLLVYYLVHKLTIRFRNIDVVIYDRQFIDMIVDMLSYYLKADVHVCRRILRFILRLLLALATQVNIIIVLDISPQIALRRKNDIWESYGELDVRRRLYLLIAAHLNACLIDATNSPQEILRKALTSCFNSNIQ
ncbi:MAG: hypothetical protein QXP29_05770 [Candidatus Nezhaarchaeales archaeon]